MKKEVKIVNGQKYYLLGVKDNKKYWLEEASFDCGWYWGLGYIEVFNKNYSDIILHTHFDSLFLNKNISEELFNFFDDNVLTDGEKWELLELMKSAYISSEYMETLHRGGANISTNKSQKIIQNKSEYDRIKDIIIPDIMKNVYNILSI